MVIKNNVVPFAALLTGLLCSHISAGQVLAPDLALNRPLILAEEQFQQGHFGISAQSSARYLSFNQGNIYNKPETEINKALYNQVVANLKLDLPASVEEARKGINSQSDPVYKERTAYTLAQYYFRHNRFAEAIPYYEMAGIANLGNLEIIDEKFELAYCYFNNRQFEKAEPLFATIKELKQGRYYTAGNYYFGLLAYNNNNYQPALKSFDLIKDLPQYRSIVPYYIAEIYYFTDEKQHALDLAIQLMQKHDKLYYDNELHLLAAQCLFEFQKFPDALPYFEYYYEHADKIRKEDVYEMAYCYYRVNDFNKAIEKFRSLSNARDSLGQTAMYLLGDCYLKEEDKQSARNAFGICADLPFNPLQQESSMILYAKLSYEMGYYDQAANQLNELIGQFPASKYHDEAKTLLSELLLKTNNYPEALKNLGAVINKNEEYSRVWQKVCYGYAMQQLKAGNTKEADQYLTLSLKEPVDENYKAVAEFWKGDLAYRRRDFVNVIRHEQDFLDCKSKESAIRYLSQVATPQHAWLNMGYAAMELNKYNDAQSYFNHARAIQNGDVITGQAAAVSEADAVFMQKDYAQAMLLYDKIISGNDGDGDYALYQKSVISGLIGKINDKITGLQSLVDKVPPSQYAGKARYELALAYIEINRYSDAIVILQPLTSRNEYVDLAPKAWMKIGFASQQMNKADNAIDAYTQVVTKFPASSERPAALDALRGIFIENNRPLAFAKLLKENNLPTADSSVFDSTFYAAAESQFAAGNWENARQSMTVYLQQYPNGAFITKAHYYRGQSEEQLKDNKEALADYDAVLKFPGNDFSESSARQAAIIAYGAKDYPAALGYYNMLRSITLNKEDLQIAYQGLMKSTFNTGGYKDASAYADTLLALPGIDEATLNETQLYKAKSLQQFNRDEEALNIYQQLENNKDGSIGAEARYHIAELYFRTARLKEAETAANNTIRLSSGYEYWVIKSYLLLADILTREKDYFNATATLKSVVKFTRIAELKEEAMQKLQQVKALEKQKGKLSED